MTKDGLSRMLAFSDGIVAVALTLLVLPLTDFFRSIKKENVFYTICSPSFLKLFFSFAVSFLVIYSFWDAHRKMFEGKTKISHQAAVLNKWWLFTIVLVPAVTSVIWDENVTNGIYIYMVIIVSNSMLLYKLRKVMDGDYKLYNDITLILILLSSVILLLFPFLSYRVFFILIFSGILHRLFPKLFFD